MPRLIDDIRASKRFTKPHLVSRAKEAGWSHYAGHCGKILYDRTMPVIDISNVAKYYYEGNDQEYWDLTKHFPNLAPPYPQFWSEFKMPHEIVSKEGNTDLSSMMTRGRCGVLYNACDPADVGVAPGEGEILPNTRWVVWCDLWIDYDLGYIDGPHSPIFFCVDAEGRIIDRPWIQSYGDDADAYATEVIRSLCGWLHPTLLSICFMHCKNVVVENHVIDKPLAKKWSVKHDGLQPTSYKTLVIEPLREILRREGKAHESGLAKAMHICRGHFSDYTQGRGLFGKYHGRFWMPATVRGSKGRLGPRSVEVRVPKGF